MVEALNPRDYGVKFDGVTDDTAALNVFFYTNVSPGDAVQFPRHAVARTTGPVSVGANLGGVTLDGNGASIRLDAGAAQGATILSFSPADGTVRNLTVDGSGVSNATGIRPKGARQLIDACRLVNCAAGGVFVGSGAAASGLLVRGNRFTGGGYGILFDNNSTAAGVTIAHNVFIGGANGDAIEVNTPAGPAADVTITGNYITGYTNAQWSGIGIGLAAVVGATITGNTITRCGLDGIHVEDASSCVSITGNTVKGCGRSGISVQVGAGTTAPSNGTIVGNTVTGCCTTNGSGGIALEGPVPVAHWAVSSNVVRGTGRAGAAVYGIELGAGSVGHMVQGNIVSNTVGSSTAGIRWKAATSLSIIGNRCFDDQPVKTQVVGLCAQGVNADVVTLGNKPELLTA